MTADDTLKILNAMRDSGAVRVKVGDVEVEFDRRYDPDAPAPNDVPKEQREPTQEEIENWSVDEAPAP